MGNFLSRANRDTKQRILSGNLAKGLVFKITVATNNSTSIGFGNNKIEVTQNDRLMLLTVGNLGLDIRF